MLKLFERSILILTKIKSHLKSIDLLHLNQYVRYFRNMKIKGGF